MQIYEFLILPIALLVMLIPGVALAQKKASFLQRSRQATRTAAMHTKDSHHPLWCLETQHIYCPLTHLWTSTALEYTLLLHFPYAYYYCCWPIVVSSPICNNHGNSDLFRQT